MFVKIVRYAKDDQPASERTYPCAHVGKTEIREGTVAHRRGAPLGLTLELAPLKPPAEGGEMISLHLPTDGDVAFLMNDAGSTIDRVSWPPRQRT